jgi:hypothetical protein
MFIINIIITNVCVCLLRIVRGCVNMCVCVRVCMCGVSMCIYECVCVYVYVYVYVCVWCLAVVCSGDFTVTEEFPEGAFLRPTVTGRGKEESPFTSMALSLYWVVVTVTSVGYGE